MQEWYISPSPLFFCGLGLGGGGGGGTMFRNLFFFSGLQDMAKTGFWSIVCVVDEKPETAPEPLNDTHPSQDTPLLTQIKNDVCCVV